MLLLMICIYSCDYWSNASCITLEQIEHKKKSMLDSNIIHLQLDDFDSKGKKQILQFYINHDLLSIDNINNFFHISDKFDILLMNYFISFMNNNTHLACIEIALKEFILYSFDDHSYGWNEIFIKFLVFCIFIGISLLQYKREIHQMIESLIEYDDPIIIDSISIILAHLSEILIFEKEN